MKVDWAEWDSVEALNTPEDISAFQGAILELGDPALLTDALDAIDRSQGKIAKIETELERKSLLDF